MEDTSEMDWSGHPASAHNHNNATPAHHHLDAAASADGSPMDWTHTNAPILGEGERPPATMPTLNQSAYQPHIIPPTHEGSHSDVASIRETILPEPDLSFFGRVYNTMGIWFTTARERAKERSKEAIRHLLSEVSETESLPHRMAAVPVGSEGSNKRRALSRPMPGSYPEESFPGNLFAPVPTEILAAINPTSSSNSTSSSNPTSSNDFTSSSSHAEEHIHAPVIPTTNIPLGVSSYVRHDKRKLKLILSENKPASTSKKTSKRNKKTASKSHNKTASASHNKKRPADAFGYEDQAPAANKARKTSNHNKSCININHTQHMNIKPICNKVDKIDGVASFLSRINSESRKKIPSQNSKNPSQDVTRIKSRFLDKSNGPVRLIPIDTISNKTKAHLIDVTQPDPMHTITQVRTASSATEKTEASLTGFFSSGPSNNAYREPEERPSTSSSSSSQNHDTETKAVAYQPRATESETEAVERKEDLDEHIEKAMKTKTFESKPQHVGKEAHTKQNLFEDSSEDELQASITITKQNMTVGDRINLRSTKTRRNMDDIMKGSEMDETEAQLTALEISESRKGVREEKELEVLKKQLMAEAEAQRKAEQEKAEAEAKRKEDEEERERAKRRQALIQPPSSQSRAEIRNALTKFTTEELRQNLSVGDLSTLVPNTSWLNDEIINCHLTDMVTKLKAINGYGAAEKRAGKAPPYHNMATQFWVNIRTKGVQSVLSWNRRSKLADGGLLSVERLFIPICDNNHWRLVVVSGTEKTVEYFDSLSMSPHPFVDRILDWVRETLGSAYDAQQWRISTGQKSPKQTNGSDCGVFTLLNARAVALGLEVTPDLYDTSTERILLARHQIAAQLLSGGVDWE
ncbi:Peptidase C48 SUMO/Sentrin/Ubl1 [Neofusicoccum parvum]|nr:Peptidase C48 SUMO/Sentrin/Ubl1 [Neofusicoccum parvum]